MKNLTNLSQSSLALLCLLAGLTSPSNGFDSAATKPIPEMLYAAFFIMLMATLAAILIRMIEIANSSHH